MSTNHEKNRSQLTRIQEFLQIVHDFLVTGDLSVNSDITTDGPDFLFEHYDEMESEAPLTNDLLQSGNIIDDLDGWQYWVEGNGYREKEYHEALQKDYDQALRLYQEETRTDWTPDTIS